MYYAYKDIQCYPGRYFFVHEVVKWKQKERYLTRGASCQMETKRMLFNKRCNMLDEIRHEQSAMDDAIPPWEWDSEYDKIRARLAREKLKIMFGGGENDL